MKLGVFTVSMPDYSPDAALEKLAALGYDGVEWRVTEDKGDPAKPSFWSGNRTSMSARQIIERAGELRTKASALKLQMPSLGAYVHAADLEAVEWHLKATAALGARNVRVGPGAYQPEAGNYRQQLAAARQQYAQVAQLARRHAVRAVIETHMGLLTPTVAAARWVLEGLDPAHVGIMWDPANQTTEGLETYPMALQSAGEYLAEVHVKNTRPVMTGTDPAGQALWKLDNCPINQGLVNWPAVIAQLKKVNYDGWLFTEDFSTDHPLDHRLAFNLQWLRSLL